MPEQAQNGIWRYSRYFPPIPQKYRLSLNEGNVNLVKAGKIYFSCEFENPSGSVKDRGLAYQISSLFSRNIKNAVISSSGNAGISASYYAQMAGINLTVFVSPNISNLKLNKLNQLGARIIQTKRPLSETFKFAGKNSCYNLRPSLDPFGHVGYSTIAFELDEKLKNTDAVFFPLSSGTTLRGVFYGYQKLGYLPRLFAVQSTSIHPIASNFDNDFSRSPKSLANSLVAKYVPQKKEIMEIIKKSKGGGWVISDAEILIAHQWLSKNNLKCSFEGAAALAALWKAQEKGYKFARPVILLTGKFYG